MYCIYHHERNKVPVCCNNISSPFTNTVQHHEQATALPAKQPLSVPK